MGIFKWVAVTVLLAVLVVFYGPTDSPAQAPGPYPELYQVTLLRAAPGKLSDLIDFLVQQKKDGYYAALGERPPMIMRHSQGDQWDLFLLQPIGSYRAYFSGEKDHRAYRTTINGLSVFREELFAFGPPAAEAEALYAENAFFHIEMFAALAGQHDALLGERVMENHYLIATGRNPNLIFTGDVGSDFDSFTIGFYPSLKEFAAPAPVSDEEANQAAIAAGFEGRSSIGFYLREFLSYHHDTLATKVE